MDDPSVRFTALEMSMMSFRARMQLAEALGKDNRWFCSQFYGREIDDPDTLLHYFINRGGAIDFARRFKEAMGDVNKWYCSEHFNKPVTDLPTLWKYYMSRHPAAARGECISAQAITRLNHDAP
jgi:hypothetical protein